MAIQMLRTTPLLRLLDYAERAVVLALFALFCISNVNSHHIFNLLILVSETLTVVFILSRRSTQAVSQRPLDWLLAFAGTMAPLLARPGGETLSLVGGVTLLAMGTSVAIAAKLSLNRSFGLAPANRGVKQHGAYAFVRHPMYLGYFLVQVGFLLLNPTWRNLALYAVAWSIQIARILREERWLLTDPDYRAYAERVSYRLAPGVF